MRWKLCATLSTGILFKGMPNNALQSQIELKTYVKYSKKKGAKKQTVTPEFKQKAEAVPGPGGGGGTANLGRGGVRDNGWPAALDALWRGRCAGARAGPRRRHGAFAVLPAVNTAFDAGGGSAVVNGGEMTACHGVNIWLAGAGGREKIAKSLRWLLSFQENPALNIKFLYKMLNQRFHRKLLWTHTT